LGEPSGRDLELNEVEWWSHWARLDWLDKSAYALTSRKFREPFFNRAGFLDYRRMERVVASIEAKFRASGVESTILVSDSYADEIDSLRQAGYEVIDSMSVLRLTKPAFETNDSLVVRPVEPTELEDWSRTYLLSFYGRTKLLSSVNEAIRKAYANKGVTLLVGTIHGDFAGVLAVQRSKGLAGVYCVGTVRRFRRTGVAGTLITEANRIAEEEGRGLILQTLESDHAERFYLKGGFRKLYTKRVLSRKLKA
jgi:GNAT superfamily N-acetyltransferase